jgi:hypothetical protein
VGTVFRVDVALPESAERAPVPERRRVVALEAGQPEIRVLVAEDDARARMLLVRLLEAVGIAVRRPTLDDVFLALTGHAADHDSAEEQPVAEAAVR